MKNLVRIIGCLLSVTLLSTAVLPASFAGSATRTDPADDASARYDLLKGRYANTEHALRASIAVSELQNVITQVRMSFNTKAMEKDNARFELYSKRRPSGNRTNKLYVRIGGDFTRLNCDGLKVTWRLGRDRILIKIPQLCLGEGYGDQRIYTNIGHPNREFADTLTRTRVTYR